MVGNDASITGNATISGNLTVNGNLTATRINNKYIVNTTTNNYQLIVSEDLSLNGRLFVAKDASLNGNLALVSNNFTGTVTPNSSAANSVSYSTSTNSTTSWFNNGITWSASVSSGIFISGTDARYPYYAFNGDIVTQSAANMWICGNNAGVYGNKYNTSSPFGYNTSGTNTNIVSTTLQNGVGATGGEWLELTTSVPVIMKDYTLYSPDMYIRAPKTYYIAGYDGTNWYPIIYVNFTSAFTSNWSTFGKITIPSGTASSVSATTTGVTYNYTYTTYGNGLTAYTKFRLITTNVFGNDGSLGLMEWIINFTPSMQTSALSMDTTNYRQLNVSSGATFTDKVGIGTANPSTQLDVTGQLRIYEANGTTGSTTRGSLTIEHGNAGGTSSIIFPSKNNNGSDYGYITYQDDVNSGSGTTNEKSILCIGTENDVTGTTINDSLILQKNGGNVGIGNSEPQYTLDVNGTFKTSGDSYLSGSSIRLPCVLASGSQVLQNGGNVIDVVNVNIPTGYSAVVFLACNGDYNAQPDVIIKPSVFGSTATRTCRVILQGYTVNTPFRINYIAYAI